MSQHNGADSIKNNLHEFYYYYYYCLLQLICHSVAVVLTLVQTEQVRINIHKRNNTQNTEHSKNNTKHSKCKYTYYQNTPTYTQPHITKQVKTNTVQDSKPNETVTI
jgi:hypothetical protein